MIDIENINDKKVDTRYNYTYVDLAVVMENPAEFIIPECLPACESLWSKNIETFMVSNYDDKEVLYVLVGDLSENNLKAFKELMEVDSRYSYDSYRSTYCIQVKGTDEKASKELELLASVFEIQDTLRFQTKDEFLESFKHEGGKYTIGSDGTIIKELNPEYENYTFEQALEKSSKKDLYIPEEGRIYQNYLFLEWHKKYQQSLQSDLNNDENKKL